jgi:hypothetical protein
MRVVSRASASVIAGRIVVSRRASLDVPAPGGTEKQDVEVRMPASPSASPQLLRMPTDAPFDPLLKLDTRFQAIS